MGNNYFYDGMGYINMDKSVHDGQLCSGCGGIFGVAIIEKGANSDFER